MRKRAQSNEFVILQILMLYRKAVLYLCIWGLTFQRKLNEMVNIFATRKKGELAEIKRRKLIELFSPELRFIGYETKKAQLCSCAFFFVLVFDFKKTHRLSMHVLLKIDFVCSLCAPYWYLVSIFVSNWRLNHALNASVSLDAAKQETKRPQSNQTESKQVKMKRAKKSHLIIAFGILNRT